MLEWSLVFWLGRVIFISLLSLSIPPTGLTKTNFDRIKSGMQRQKVEAILGCPPGDYRTGPTVSCLAGFASLAVEDNTLRKLTWQGDRTNIEIWIDPKGLVKYSSYELMKPKPLGFVRKFLWRFDHWLKTLLKNSRRTSLQKSAPSKQPNFWTILGGSQEEDSQPLWPLN